MRRTANLKHAGEAATLPEQLATWRRAIDNLSAHDTSREAHEAALLATTSVAWIVGALTRTLDKTVRQLPKRENQLLGEILDSLGPVETFDERLRILEARAGIATPDEP